MAVIFGEINKDSLMKVGSISWQIESHPDGISVDKVPEYPSPVKGINSIMYFNTITKEFSFIEETRPLTSEEIQEERLTGIENKLNDIIILLGK